MHCPDSGFHLTASVIASVVEARIKSGAEPAPDSSAMRDEKVRKVHQLLATVPEQFRLVLTMRLIEERSYQEIAGLLGIPLHSVKNSMVRGGRILVDKIRSHPGLAPKESE